MCLRYGKRLLEENRGKRRPVSNLTQLGEVLRGRVGVSGGWAVYNEKPQRYTMTETEALKNKIVQEISDLPAEKLGDVLTFVSKLGDEEKQSKGKPGGEPERDPILKFIGGVSHGSLAHEIDDELYGRSL